MRLDLFGGSCIVVSEERRNGGLGDLNVVLNKRWDMRRMWLSRRLMIVPT